MARTTISFEAGANGDPINTTSVPAGMQQVDITGSPTSQYSTAQAAVGTKSWFIDAATSTLARGRRSGLNVDRLAFRFFIRLTATPSASGQGIYELRDTSSAIVFTGALDINRTFYIIPKSGSTTSLGILALNTWYRIEGEVIKGTSSTTGSWNVRAYLLNDTTATYSGSSSTADLGTVNFSQVNTGKVTSAPTLQAYFDDVVIDDGTTTPIGPPATNVAPTASAGTAQHVEREAVVTQVGTDADADGTVASRAWTVTAMPAGASTPALTGAATNIVSFTAAAAGVYTLQYVVTDNAGLMSTPSTVSIYVYPHTNEDVTVRNLTIGAWSQFGNAGTAVAGLNDALQTTGVQSPVNPTTGQPVGMQMNPYGPGDIKLYVEGSYIDAPVNRTVNVLKEDGTTLVYTTQITPTASSAEVLVSLDSAALAAVPNLSDRRGLIVRFASAVA